MKLLMDSARIELALVFLIPVVVYLLAWNFELAENLYAWTREHEYLEADELFLCMLTLSITMMVYSMRHWRIAREEIEHRRQLEQELIRRQKITEELLQENRHLLDRINRLREQEQERIAMELHDEFGQHLTGIHTLTSSLLIKSKGDGKFERALNSILNSSEHLYELLRYRLKQLRPMILDTLGFEAAANALLEDWRKFNHEAECEFTCLVPTVDLDKEINNTLFRCLQEGLNNISKHSKAKLVQVRLSEQAESEPMPCLDLCIISEGPSSSRSSMSSGLGIAGMRERARALGGQLNFSRSNISNNCERSQLHILIPYSLAGATP